MTFSLEEKLFGALSGIWVIRGTWVQIPLRAPKSFSSNENVIQRVVRPWSPLNSLYIYIYISRIDRFTETMCSQQKDPTDTMPPRKFIDKYLK